MPPVHLRVPPVDALPAELHGQPVLDLVVFHREADAAAQAALEPLRTLAPTILDTVGVTPYLTAQTAFDANLPAGARYFSRAHDLAALSDEAVDTFCRHVRTMVGPMTIAYLEPKGGVAGRVPPGATAMGGRDAAYGLHVLAGWSDPADDAAAMAWTRGFAEAMEPHATGGVYGVYVNLLAEDEAHRVDSAFSDPGRLRALKQRWDPRNIFASNHNIAPEGAGG